MNIGKENFRRRRLSFVVPSFRRSSFVVRRSLLRWIATSQRLSTVGCCWSTLWLVTLVGSMNSLSANGVGSVQRRPACLLRPWFVQVMLLHRMLVGKKTAGVEGDERDCDHRTVWLGAGVPRLENTTGRGDQGKWKRHHDWVYQILFIFF